MTLDPVGCHAGLSEKRTPQPARREGAILFLPAGCHFTLDGEIKNVVTAVAKTYHYWIEHQAAGR